MRGSVRESRRVGVDLALHAGAQQQAECAGMGADQLQARLAVEEIAEQIMRKMLMVLSNR